MEFDLKTPCKNCPFRNGTDRIVFRGRERAEEIAETAYREGFPCHLSAEYDEFRNGFVPGERTQHCAGSLAMFARDACGSPWPGINNSERRLKRVTAQLEPIFDQVFKSEEAFIAANFDPRFDGDAAP